MCHVPAVRRSRRRYAEIVAKVGEGGMGGVSGARYKLARDVALKVIPDAFAHDAERLAQFEREARTLASLNHPHIAQCSAASNSRAA